MSFVYLFQEAEDVSASDIAAIVDRLPEVNRLVLMGLVKTMREVSENESVNRMSLKVRRIL